MGGGSCCLGGLARGSGGVGRDEGAGGDNAGDEEHEEEAGGDEKIVHGGWSFLMVLASWLQCLWAWSAAYNLTIVRQG